MAPAVAERDIQRIERTFGAVALLRRAGKRRAVEGEVCGIDLRGQHVGVHVDLVEGKPILPGLQRL